MGVDVTSELGGRVLVVARRVVEAGECLFDSSMDMPRDHLGRWVVTIIALGGELQRYYKENDDLRMLGVAEALLALSEVLMDAASWSSSATRALLHQARLDMDATGTFESVNAWITGAS